MAQSFLEGDGIVLQAEFGMPTSGRMNRRWRRENRKKKSLSYTACDFKL